MQRFLDQTRAVKLRCGGGSRAGERAHAPPQAGSLAVYSDMRAGDGRLAGQRHRERPEAVNPGGRDVQPRVYAP